MCNERKYTEPPKTPREELILGVGLLILVLLIAAAIYAICQQAGGLK